MTQPFRKGTRYTPTFFKDIYVALNKDHLVIQNDYPLQTLSSALWRGGAQTAKVFVNWKVPLDYRCDQPMTLMKQKIEEWGYGVDQTIGMQTAAKLTYASIFEEKGDQFTLFCCTTAGTSNAARAGTIRETFSAYSCGTINTILLVDGRLTPAAMVNALMTATEAKAAALQDLQIRDENGEIATGTTTDSVILAVSQRTYDEVHAFAGAATTIGNAIGRLVYESVYEAVATGGEV